MQLQEEEADAVRSLYIHEYVYGNSGRKDDREIFGKKLWKRGMIL